MVLQAANGALETTVAKCGISTMSSMQQAILVMRHRW